MPTAPWDSATGGSRSSTCPRNRTSRWSMPSSASRSSSTARSTTTAICGASCRRSDTTFSRTVTRRSYSRPTGPGENAARSACTGCSLSPSGTCGQRPCSSRATASASSRSTARTTTTASASRRRLRHCSPPARWTRASIRWRCTSSLRCTRSCRRRARSSPVCASSPLRTASRSGPTAASRCGAFGTSTPPGPTGRCATMSGWRRSMRHCARPCASAARSPTCRWASCSRAGSTRACSSRCSRRSACPT